MGAKEFAFIIFLTSVVFTSIVILLIIKQLMKRR